MPPPEGDVVPHDDSFLHDRVTHPSQVAADGQDVQPEDRTYLTDDHYASAPDPTAYQADREYQDQPLKYREDAQCTEIGEKFPAKGMDVWLLNMEERYDFFGIHPGHDSYQKLMGRFRHVARTLS